MKFKRVKVFRNAVSIKAMPNREVSVFNNKNDNTPILQFVRADCTKDELNVNPSFHQVIRGKLSCMEIQLSREAGLALFYALGIYFEKISPNTSLTENSGPEGN